VVTSNFAGTIASTHGDAALMIQRRRSTLRSRNHLDQNYKPPLHRFIFEGGVGAQQSEAENVVDDEQIWLLAVTIAEKRYVDAEPLSDFLELRRADPAHAFFVFLRPMRGEAEVIGQLCLRDAFFLATQTDSPPYLDVRVPGRSWVALG
jgi:hypothetical protein